MTMQRLESFGKVWKKTPPEHVSLARINALLRAFMGVKDSVEPDNEAAHRLMNMSDTEE